jgi:protein SCO1
MGNCTWLRRRTIEGKETMSRLNGRGLFVARICLCLGCSAVLPGNGNAHSNQQVVQRREVRIPIQDFSLIDQGNRAFRFKSLSGKVVLIAFAYTTCPDVCPLITAAMRRVQADMADTEQQAVHLLTVTTDPEIDEPKVLAAYAKRYGADLSNWAFLTGDGSSLGKVWKNFGVKVDRKARGLVDHTPLVALIDQKGAMRFAYYGTSPDPKAVLRDLRSLLARRH